MKRGGDDGDSLEEYLDSLHDDLPLSTDRLQH